MGISMITGLGIDSFLIIGRLFRLWAEFAFIVTVILDELFILFQLLIMIRLCIMSMLFVTGVLLILINWLIFVFIWDCELLLKFLESGVFVMFGGLVSIGLGSYIKFRCDILFAMGFMFIKELFKLMVIIFLSILTADLWYTVLSLKLIWFIVFFFCSLLINMIIRIIIGLWLFIKVMKIFRFSEINKG